MLLFKKISSKLTNRKLSFHFTDKVSIDRIRCPIQALRSELAENTGDFEKIPKKSLWSENRKTQNFLYVFRKVKSNPRDLGSPGL